MIYLKRQYQVLSFDVDAHGNRQVTWVNECVMWVMLTNDVCNDAVREAKKADCTSLRGYSSCNKKRNKATLQDTTNVKQGIKSGKLAVIVWNDVDNLSTPRATCA